MSISFIKQHGVTNNDNLKRGTRTKHVAVRPQKNFQNSEHMEFLVEGNDTYKGCKKLRKWDISKKIIQIRSMFLK